VVGEQGAKIDVEPDVCADHEEPRAETAPRVLNRAADPERLRLDDIVDLAPEPTPVTEVFADLLASETYGDDQASTGLTHEVVDDVLEEGAASNGNQRLR